MEVSCGSLLSCLVDALRSAECTAALLSRLPPALRVLQFFWRNAFSPEVFAAQLPHQLTTLRISSKHCLTGAGCSLSSASVEALVAAGLPETLEEINLRANPIGDEGAVALAKGIPRRLKILNLNRKIYLLTQLECSLSAAGIAALVAVLPFTLEELRLSFNPMGDEGAIELAKGLPPELKGLYLKGKYGLLTH